MEKKHKKKNQNYYFIFAYIYVSDPPKRAPDSKCGAERVGVRRVALSAAAGDVVRCALAAHCTGT